MAADAKRQLDLVVNVVGKDGGAAAGLGGLERALSGLQGSIDKLGGSLTKAGGAAEAEARKGFAERVVGAGKDFLTGTAGKLAGGLGAVGALTGGAVRLNDAIERLGYSFLTTEEKMRGMLEAIPLIGSTLSGFVSSTMDAMDRLAAPGAAKQLTYDSLFMAPELARSSARAGYQRQVYGVRQQDLTAGYAGQALRELPSLASEQARAYLGGQTDRGFGAFAGFVAENDPLRDAKEQIRSAERALKAAQLGADASAADVSDARKTSGRANDEWEAARRRAEMESKAVLDPGAGVPGRNDYSRLRARGASRGAAFLGLVGGGIYDTAQGVAGLFGADDGGALNKARAGVDREFRGGGSGNKIDALAAMNKEQRALVLAQNALADLEAKVTTNKERQLELARKQNELAKAQTGLMKAQLSVLDEQAAKVKGGARQFGAMDDFNRAGLVNAFERFREQGREGVSAGELALLQGNALTGDEVNKRLEKDVSKDPEFQKLLKLTGNRDLETIEEERKKLRAEIDLKLQVDEEKFAKTLEDTLKKLNLKDLLGDIVKNQLEMKLRGITMESDRGRLERS